ncbi:hypothetical protein JTB14_026761 [Gonioctena quinquepunctata]|nr:hypothetical protein JTB14_026761 [Gonioctena quinquepunctata]
MSVTLGMMIITERVPFYKEELRTNCFQIDLGGVRVKRKILNESIKIKIFCVFLLIISVATHLSFVPFIGDEDTFICQYKVVYHVSGKSFGTIITIIALAVQGWILLIVIFGPAHIIFQNSR